MEIQTPKQINPSYKINKQEIEKLFKPQIKKPTDENKTRIYPYLPVSVCENLIQQNVLLTTCIQTLAEDVIFNNVNITSNKENDDKEQKIKEFWEINQDELKNEFIDYFSYGFGGAEVVFDNYGEPSKLYQIPADTLTIKKESKRNIVTGELEWSHYAYQEVNGQNPVKMKLAHLDYDESDDNLPTCLWIGGGRKSDFFDYPIWISAFNQVSASVALDMLDAQKINDGNLISGILIIKRPPAPINENEDIEGSLEEKMEEKGSGIFTLELVSMNPNIPLDVQYIQISESNYNYLLELGSKCDVKILAIFKIPKARLLIDEGSESMNSNKTNTLYKIYGKELNNKQRPIENLMRVFNKKFFDFDGFAEIETPVFVDDKETEVAITLNLFNNGLITLGQAINKVFSLFPEFSNYLDEPIDYNNPIYSERMYHGNPLGFTGNIEGKGVSNVGELLEYLNTS